jgi:hypothetical protein
MSEDRPPDLVWDSCDYEDPDSASFAWDDLTEELTRFIQAVNPDGEWSCEVRNFGWRHQDGHGEFSAGNGLTFLRKVLPRTECTFKVWLSEDDKKVTINNAHHDAPTGGELYFIRARASTTPTRENRRGD